MSERMKTEPDASMDEKHKAEDAVCNRALIAIQGGDQSALGVIYETWGRMILAVARRVAGIPYDRIREAEDILHEVMVKILKQAHNYRPHTSPRAWIMAITRTCAIDHRSKHAPTESLEEAWGISAPEPDADAEALREAMSGLTPDDRLLLQLRTYVGLSHKEIGQVMGLKEAAVRKRYSRALQILRERLTEPNTEGGNLS